MPTASLALVFAWIALVAAAPSARSDGNTPPPSTTEVSAPPDFASYVGKYVLTEKGTQVSGCKKITAKLARRMAAFRHCSPFHGENAPLTTTTAKCEKADGTHAYIFEAKKDCVGASQDLNDGNAS